MSKIYLAHPITGLNANAVFDYYDSVCGMLGGQHTAMSPMTGKDYLRDEGVMRKSYEEHPSSRGHAIFERDKWMVSSSDVILCDLTGAEKASIGCCMELAWAAMFGKHAIVVMEDSNPHNHPFVNEAADVVFATLEEALVYINQLP